MIINQRFKAPVISFGLGRTSLICEAGESVTIWQNEIYNSNEYSLIQNEVEEIISLTYSDLKKPDEELKADFIKVGEYNKRAYYLNESSFTEKAFIFWDSKKWLTVFSFDATNGTFRQELGSLNLDIPLPVSPSWIIGKTEFKPLKTTSNVNTQSFTIQAKETKEIKVQMKIKNSEQLLNSNKIKLIVK
jgi:hypothetical protein